MHLFRPAVPVAILVSLSLVALIVACGGSTPEPAAAPAAPATPVSALAAETEPPQATATSVPTTAATEAPTAAATEAIAATEAPTETPTEEPAAAAGQTDFMLGEGTIARYKVEEVLVNTGFKVATGETFEVTGSIAFDADGGVIAEESRIVVQAATLQTDSNRRDGYVRNRILLTDTYPEVVFQPTSMDGLPDSVSDASGPVEFTMTGDLTVRDQTREVTWDAMAEFAGDGTASGLASVMFTFEDFGMDKPRVAIVVSVEDEILLELDFAGTITGP